VVAFFLSRSPASASTIEPTHTDITTSLLVSVLRIQSSILGERPCCAGTTSILGSGASSNVKFGVTSIPSGSADRRLDVGHHVGLEHLLACL
jgi:hypothetical protein